MATRCCWPPEGRPGRRSRKGPRRVDLQRVVDAGPRLGRGQALRVAGRRQGCPRPSYAARAHSPETPCRCGDVRPAQPCRGDQIIRPVERDPPGVGHHQPRDNPQKRGLARAGGPEQRDDLARPRHRRSSAVQDGLPPSDLVIRVQTARWSWRHLSAWSPKVDAARRAARGAGDAARPRPSRPAKARPPRPSSSWLSRRTTKGGSGLPALRDQKL